jgi:hypothetical protein
VSVEGHRKLRCSVTGHAFGTPNVSADLKPVNLFLPLGTVSISELFGNGVIVLLVVLGRVIR